MRRISLNANFKSVQMARPNGWPSLGCSSRSLTEPTLVSGWRDRVQAFWWKLAELSNVKLRKKV